MIATLQVKDFFGLSIDAMPEHYWDKLAVLGQQLPALDGLSTLVAVVTLAVMLLWPRLTNPPGAASSASSDCWQSSGIVVERWWRGD